MANTIIPVLPEHNKPISLKYVVNPYVNLVKLYIINIQLAGPFPRSLKCFNLFTMVVWNTGKAYSKCIFIKCYKTDRLC